LTVGRAFDGRRNNFDLIRLGAALTVLFSHSFVLTGHADEEPIARLLGHRMDGGGLAVAVFFVLSGFLIARSGEIHPLGVFARARVLRIVPAYAVLLVLQTLVLGAATTRLPIGAYLADGATWTALGRGLGFSPVLGLPGVFEHNPLPFEVNGSLWTLRIEVACYVGVGVLMALRLGRPWVSLVVLGAVIAGLIGAGDGHAALSSVLRNVLFFASGMALWFWRGRVVLSWWVLAVVVAGSVGTGEFAAGLPYVVLYVGLGVAAPGWLNPARDVSYGTYLYAFPVQQCLASVAPGIGPYAMAGLSVGPVLVLAWLSQRMIEAPALRLK